MENDRQSFDSWALVEVMGHSRYAGRVTEQQIGGASFIRIDVPELSPECPAFTKLLGAASIFAITPCSEPTARAAAAAWRVQPMAAYDLPTRSALAYDAPPPDDDDEEDDWDDDGE